MKRCLAVLAVGATIGIVAGPGASPAIAAPGDIGFEGHSYAPLGGSPTGSKPESKLWFNDGSWWAPLFDPAAASLRIYRLDRASERWLPTPTLLDSRTKVSTDVLWDAASSKLYVASHLFTESAAAASASSAGRLTRYSYANGVYTQDGGFPVTINAAKTETLVIDKDTSGTLWATWTAGSRVYVNHSLGGNDAAWGAPYVLPTPDPGATQLDGDDISSLIAFNGQIGVMWSNQADGRMYFAVHPDGAGDGSWTTTAVPTGASPDDHINLKADSAGRVFAAVKTSESSGSQPRTLLLARSAGGAWTTTIFGTVSNSHTRAIIELDQQHGVLHMFATCPQPPASSGQSGGDICQKTTRTDSIAFAPGIGTAIIRNQGSPELNDATSTKQDVDGSTGLVVLANDTVENRYWHADLGLGAPPPLKLAAAFGVDTNAGPTPLDVLFSDSSTGSPTSWSWSFGDGSTSTARNPTHRYATPGVYTVTLRVATATQTATHSQTVVVSGIQVLPDSSESHAGAAAAMTKLTIRGVRLRQQRVRIAGTVRPLRSGTKATLLRKATSGRWLFLRRVRVRVAASSDVGAYAFVVRRGLRRTSYRVVIAVPGQLRRSTHTVVLAPRAR